MGCTALIVPCGRERFRLRRNLAMWPVSHSLRLSRGCHSPGGFDLCGWQWLVAGIGQPQHKTKV